MKKEVEAAIAEGIKARRKLLQELSHSQRVSLLEELFKDLFGDHHLTLQKWAALTGQTAQVDTGYIAQFVASLVLGEPGQGFRGKGDDLADGGEVKSAANISGVDRPRWNHHMATVAADKAAREKGKPTNFERYLAAPYLFYLLADRAASEEKTPHDIRVRAWLVDAQGDTAWRGLFTRYQEQKAGGQYNLQLHPPVGYDDDLVVNTLGNLDFAEVLLFDARVAPAAGATTVTWVKPLPEDPFRAIGHTKPRLYGSTQERPTNSTAVEDLVADLAVLPELFPGVLLESQEEVVLEATQEEADAD